MWWTVEIEEKKSDKYNGGDLQWSESEHEDDWSDGIGPKVCFGIYSLLGGDLDICSVVQSFLFW